MIIASFRTIARVDKTYKAKRIKDVVGNCILDPMT
jgi:hypothetical protein